MTCYNLSQKVSSHDPHLSLSLTMKASSAAKANVISLLLSGHSMKVESITGLEKSVVGRIYQELEMDKENYK